MEVMEVRVSTSWTGCTKYNSCSRSSPQRESVGGFTAVEFRSRQRRETMWKDLGDMALAFKSTKQFQVFYAPLIGCDNAIVCDGHLDKPPSSWFTRFR